MKPLYAIAFLLVLPFASSAPCHFPSMFNLGASNSDTGGYAALNALLEHPYGETYFHAPSGRFSDGRIILDFMAEKLRLPFLNSYLDVFHPEYSHGANFGVGGATILPQNVSLTVGGTIPFFLDIQLREFSRFKNKSQRLNSGGKHKHSLPKNEYFSQALYTFDVGQNDITAIFFSGKSPDEYLPKAMQEFSRIIKGIYALGGRYFWIHNTGPLGCLPAILSLLPPSFALDFAGCAVVANDLAKKFNRALNETVDQLIKELPHAAITYVDIYTAKYTLFSQPHKFGFVHPFKTCCGYGGGKYNFHPGVVCSQSAMINGTLAEGKSCGEPNRRIIWDGSHYTEAANKWTYELIESGNFTYPPNTLDTACRR